MKHHCQLKHDLYPLNPPFGMITNHICLTSVHTHTESALGLRCQIFIAITFLLFCTSSMSLMISRETFSIKWTFITALRQSRPLNKQSFAGAIKLKWVEFFRSLWLMEYLRQCDPNGQTVKTNLRAMLWSRTFRERDLDFWYQGSKPSAFDIYFTQSFRTKGCGTAEEESRCARRIEYV